MRACRWGTPPAQLVVHLVIRAAEEGLDERAVLPEDGDRVDRNVVESAQDRVALDRKQRLDERRRYDRRSEDWIELVDLFVREPEEDGAGLPTRRAP